MPANKNSTLGESGLGQSELLISQGESTAKPARRACTERKDKDVNMSALSQDIRDRSFGRTTGPAQSEGRA